jgi:hypothetical protein
MVFPDSGMMFAMLFWRRPFRRNPPVRPVVNRRRHRRQFDPKQIERRLP